MNWFHALATFLPSWLILLVPVSGFLMTGEPLAGEIKPGWKAEWANILQAAKKEGQVTVYTGGTAAGGVATFRAAYPDIKLVIASGRGELVQRALLERRAGKYLADVSINGITGNYRILHKAKSFDPIGPALMLPEVTDESKWWQQSHRYVDSSRKYVFIFQGSPEKGSIDYNTKLVDPKGFKSFWDFVHPRWKGKIVVKDPRLPGSGSDPMRFYYHSPELGPEFIKKLFGDMEVTLVASERLGMDWLASSKFAICFFCGSGEVIAAKRQGLPVDEFGFMKEGASLVARGGTLALMNNAPHPNAAKVFINWLLSREGQLAFLKGSMRETGGTWDSLRVDIPRDDVAPQYRRTEGIKYLEIDVAERLDWEPIASVIKEALARTGRK